MKNTHQEPPHLREDADYDFANECLRLYFEGISHDDFLDHCYFNGYHPGRLKYRRMCEQMIALQTTRQDKATGVNLWLMRNLPPRTDW